MSKASEIALEINSRLQQITVANGYATDIGLRVYRGRRKLDPAQLPCAVLVNDEDACVSGQDKRCVTKATYQLEGHSPCDAENPGDVGHQIVADLKKAIFSGDLSFGKTVLSIDYKGRTIEPREDGLSLVSAAIEIDLHFTEDLAAP